jgi:regulator of protease activity HflC (stomatin/prohibitin superfamily)
MRIKTIVIAIAAMAASVTGLSGCAYKAMGPGVQSVVQNGSMFPGADKTLIDCIQPSVTKNEMFRQVFKYPARQISLDATGGKDSQRGPYVVVSSAKAPAEMDVPVVVTFDLTRDCDKLKKFHAEFGTKYSGWLNDDGSESQGWKDLVNYVVGQPLQDTLNGVAQNYTWKEIWNDEAARTEFRTALAQTLPKESQARTNGVAYFTNFQILVLKPTPVNPELKAAIEAQQAAVQRAQATQAEGVAQAAAAQAKADADLTAAKSQTALAEQKAIQQQAEINGYGGVDAYLRALCIQQHCNPFQPTYVVPQGGGQH